MSIWKREVQGRMEWNCVNSDGYVTNKVYAEIMATDEYTRKPEEDIDNWAINVLDKLAEEICKRSCNALSVSVYCNDYSVIRIDTPEEEAPEIPGYILDRIDKIRDYIDEAESYDEKKSLQDEAVNLLRDYMSESEAREFVKI